MWKGEHEGAEVAVKVLRATSDNLDKIRSVGHHPKPSGSVSEGAYHDCAEILQGSHDVERSSPSKRAPIVRSDDDREPLRNDISVDGSREH